MTQKITFTIILALTVISQCRCQSDENITANNNEFAFDIFKEIAKTDYENIFISPLSISSALSMTYDGAAGNTAKEMKKVLRFDMSQKKSHAEFIRLLNSYRTASFPLFYIANAVIAQEDYDFKSSYLQSLRDYNSLIKTANFKDENERLETLKYVNEWISENTGGKIEDMLGDNSLNSLSRLVLLNAIYFKADWEFPFTKENTQKNIFYGLNDTQYETDFMNSRRKYNFYEDAEIRMLEIPYKNNDASLFVIQPGGTRDFDKFCQELDYSQFNSLEKQLTNHIFIDLYIPKFSMAGKYELKQTLQNMGMKDAFTGKANFTKMNGRSDLMIDNVIHQSFIEIDEKGTEAAASTSVIMMEKSAPKVRTVNIDKPFILIIKEKYENSILFIGKFVKP